MFLRNSVRWQVLLNFYVNAFNKLFYQTTCKRDEEQINVFQYDISDLDNF